MAMARVTITCRRCGKKFEIKKKCYNRSDANSFEAWAESALLDKYKQQNSII